MKKLLTLVLICMIALSAMAQSHKIVRQSLLTNHDRKHLNRLEPQTELERLRVEKVHKPAIKSPNSQTQRLDSMIDVAWDSSTSQWINSSKVEYTYDANGNRTSYINP